jgi:hypothetical protein
MQLTQQVVLDEVLLLLLPHSGLLPPPLPPLPPLLPLALPPPSLLLLFTHGAVEGVEGEEGGEGPAPPPLNF